MKAVHKLYAWVLAGLLSAVAFPAFATDPPTTLTELASAISFTSAETGVFTAAGVIIAFVILVGGVWLIIRMAKRGSKG